MTGVYAIMIILCVSVLLPGLINRTRSVMSGRKGLRFFQHILNAGAMMHKGVVTGHTSTLLFTVAPSVYFTSVFTAALIMPVGNLVPFISFNGDIVAFFYLLALGRLAIILAALDTGSSFEGMGASREALYGAMIEPALFLVAGTLTLVSRSTGFAQMFHSIQTSGLPPETFIVLMLLVYVVVKIILVECGRIPVDDPRTHLELTMIHEVMVLDYSGVDLAVVQMANWLKMGVLAILSANIFASACGAGWGAASVIAPLVGVSIGILESVVARNKLSRNTTYILTISALALVLFLVAYLVRLDINLNLQ